MKGKIVMPHTRDYLPRRAGLRFSANTENKGRNKYYFLPAKPAKITTARIIIYNCIGNFNGGFNPLIF
jgi:hypothetical protein